MTRTLGTLLRSLVERLDSAVEQAYVDANLDYRPRYTPVLRSLRRLGAASIRAIAHDGPLTHSATSQTVAQMTKAGLVEVARGDDAREHVVRLTPKARRMLPKLEALWSITNEAAHALEGELPYSLSRLLEDTLKALDEHSFEERRAAIIRTHTNHGYRTSKETHA